MFLCYFTCVVWVVVLDLVDLWFWDVCFACGFTRFEMMPLGFDCT